MARYKAPYTLYLRGKVWYYRTYSPEGLRTAGCSTGCTAKCRAREYCERLQKNGFLYQGSSLNFALYAEHFFDDDSTWMRDRAAGGTIDRPAMSESYKTSLRYINRLYLIPFFGAYKVADLRPSITKLFRSWMVKKGLSNKTINMAVSVFKLITDTAIADGLLLIDPLKTIKPFPTNAKSRDAFTLNEIKSMMPAVWRDSDIGLFTLTAAVTGMRYSEILAIRKETLNETYIDVKDQVLHNAFLPLKTHIARKVPIPEKLYTLLKVNITEDGMIFTSGSNYYREHFIADCGIKSKERKERCLTFHSLRHFFNTYLLSENVSSVKVAAVMGHSTGKGSMQERYTNWRPEMFPEVYDAQYRLIDKLLAAKTVR
jgi:integrase